MKGGYLGAVAAAAALGGLLFGWDWVVIGGAKPFFESYFQLHSPAAMGWANSCALIGCLAGALAAGASSNRFGRKPPLLAAGLLFAVTSIGNALAQTYPIFIAWRMLGGVAIGLASSLSPMYIAEIAPAGARGRYVSINQLTIVLGILFAQAVNWFVARNLPSGANEAFIRNSWYGTEGWRWMFGLTAAPSLLFFAAMCWAPESPRWLIADGHTERARRVLKRLGGDAYAAAAVTEIQRSLTVEQLRPAGAAELLNPRLRRVLVVAVVLALFQQWCGINVIFNYAEEIFRAAGYDISAVLKNIAWTGSVNLVFTLAAIGVVDRGGRRPLLLFGSAGLALVYLALGICYHAGLTGPIMLALVLAAIACYAISLAPVTWVVIAEIFPNRVRGPAMSLTVGCLWGACFVLTYSFPLLNAELGPAGTFWLYSVICFAGLAFIAGWVPETKGKTLEELERILVSAPRISEAKPIAGVDKRSE